ncbi:MAG: RpiB/LacA/LacB family sugar-phosphate isomerase [Elusimicrobiales bacterium]|jgi:ribose 5-phosphate isomerase B|nr:RpiB/LacA/LacB family sugar-phosphate isomerase [Elusimicrobiales bacterium]HOJ86836.1 RpiB/LacA/LacB family sugar-phosphate isomerase [Elusimicrobiales bacterium]HOL62512.1 RpiB/LacA/LacB family sugar-phosphate isomerase [Elusimicrobiales bacterium]HPO94560.1 RpiB/LacA/LacB family sugar-phosphate isomerase [Elusimicrobiales bacterium]
MKIVIGSDHAGFEAKEKLKKFLQSLGHDVIDFGCYSTDPVDFTDIAMLVGEAIKNKEFEKGILIDGFGGAMPLAANKIHGIRAVCAYDIISARFASAHENCNILCLGGKTHGELALQEITKTWLNTPFEGGKYQKRLDKITAIENKY